MNNSSSLSTGTASGSQSATQDPQSIGQSGNLSAPKQASSLQPDITGSQLNSTGGIVLPASSTLPSIPLGTSTGTLQSTPSQSGHHHINSSLLALAILLFVAAVVLFASTMRGAKNTTDYL